MTDKKIKELLNDMVIQIDSREHLPNHITNMFDSVGVKWEVEKLKSGDYTAYIKDDEGNKINAELAIERKMGLNEVGVNLSTHRARFKREFERKEIPMLLMIEEDTYSDIVDKRYRNKIEPNAFLASLHSLSAEFDVPFIFVPKDSSPVFIYKTLYYNLRNKLKKEK